jgi:peroxiredoxin family protein
MIISKTNIVAAVSLLSVSSSATVFGTFSGVRRLRNHDIIAIQVKHSVNSLVPINATTTTTTTKNKEQEQYTNFRNDNNIIMMAEQILSEKVRWLQEMSMMSMDMETGDSSMSMMVSTASAQDKWNPIVTPTGVVSGGDDPNTTSVSSSVPILQQQGVVNVESEDAEESQQTGEDGNNESPTVLPPDEEDEPVDTKNEGEEVEVTASARKSITMVSVAILFFVPFFA